MRYNFIENILFQGEVLDLIWLMLGLRNGPQETSESAYHTIVHFPEFA